jgi:hypothetical protein
MVATRENSGRRRRRSTTQNVSKPKAKIAGPMVAASARDQLPCEKRARTRQTATSAAHATTTVGVLNGRRADGGWVAMRPEDAMVLRDLQRNGRRAAATPDHIDVRPPRYRVRMQSEQARQRRRERKRLERDRVKKAARKTDELDFLLPRRIAALFKPAERAPRERASDQPPRC